MHNHLIRRHVAALIFWGLLIVYLLLFGTYVLMVALLILAVALELVALLDSARYGVAARSRWQAAASLLAIAAAIAFLIPSLIEQAYGDRVYAYFGDDPPSNSGTNVFGLYASLGFTGVCLASLAAWAWTIYFVRQRRRRPPSSLSHPG